MTKVPFNQEGLDLKRSMLSQLPPAEFMQQLELVQHETREWYIDNFQLNMEQIEYVNAIPQLMIDYIGIHSRIAFQFNEPYTLEVPGEYHPPLSADKPRHVKPTVKGGGSWNPGTGELNYKVEFGVKFTIPL
jgi:hypothetical protein